MPPHDPPTPADAGQPPRPSVLSSARGFDGKLLHVRVDRVRLPSGRETAREVVEHPGAVAVLPLTADGRVLFIRQYHHPIGEALLGIPAGTVEPGEDPAATARRELVEETGHAADRLVELTSFFTSPGYSTERLTVFRADGCRPTGGRPAADELIELVALPLAEVPALVRSGPERIREAKTLVALLWLLVDPA
jgi:ADP-ribose pyrophosphatase